MRYLILVPICGNQEVKIEADTKEEAIIKVKEGEGDFGEIVYICDDDSVEFEAIEEI